MGCRVGNRSTHRRSFPVRNNLPEWENTDHPVMRSTLCNILAASSGRRGECGRSVTNQFEGTGVVLGAQLTRRNLYHRVGGSKIRILNCISPAKKKANTHRIVVVTFRLRFRLPINPVYQELAKRVEVLNTINTATAWRVINHNGGTAGCKW
jgi:hypothetical protein